MRHLSGIQVQVLQCDGHWADTWEEFETLSQAKTQAESINEENFTATRVMLNEGVVCYYLPEFASVAYGWEGAKKALEVLQAMGVQA